MKKIIGLFVLFLIIFSTFAAAECTGFPWRFFGCPGGLGETPDPTPVPDTQTQPQTQPTASQEQSSTSLPEQKYTLVRYTEGDEIKYLMLEGEIQKPDGSKNIYFQGTISELKNIAQNSGESVAVKTVTDFENKLNNNFDFTEEDAASISESSSQPAEENIPEGDYVPVTDTYNDKIIKLQSELTSLKDQHNQAKTAKNKEETERLAKEIQTKQKELSDAKEEAEKQIKEKYNTQYTDKDLRRLAQKEEAQYYYTELNTAKDKLTKAEKAFRDAKTDEETKTAQAELDEAKKNYAAASANVDLIEHSFDRAIFADLSGAERAGTRISYAYEFVNRVQTYPNIENLIFKDMEWYKTWQTSVDKVFANTYLNGWLESAFCNIPIYQKPGEATLMIEQPSGEIQSIASIQAERSLEKSFPLICNDDPENYFPCPGDLLCREGLCYETRLSETPELGYFYKITWGVTAPQDSRGTILTDEARNEIDFNLKVEDHWLFIDQYTRTGDENTIHLGFGNSSRQLNLPAVIVDYSSEKYDQICIVFGDNKPKDFRGIVSKRSIGGINFISRNIIPTIAGIVPGRADTDFTTSDRFDDLKKSHYELCTTFKESDVGQLEYADATGANAVLSGLSNSASTPNSADRSAGGTYCGVGGC